MFYAAHILNLQAVLSQESCVQVEMTQWLAFFLEPSVHEPFLWRFEIFFNRVFSFLVSK